MHKQGREHFRLPELHRAEGKAATCRFGQRLKRRCALSIARAQQAKSLGLRAAMSLAGLCCNQGKLQEARVLRSTQASQATSLRNLTMGLRAPRERQ